MYNIVGVIKYRALVFYTGISYWGFILESDHGLAAQYVASVNLRGPRWGRENKYSDISSIIGLGEI